MSLDDLLILKKTKSCKLNFDKFLKMQELNNDVNPKVLNPKEKVISFKCELQENLQKAMKKFVEEHPNLDQYEIIHRAIAGFLMDKGFYNREITKLIGIKIFSKKF